MKILTFFSPGLFGRSKACGRGERSKLGPRRRIIPRAQFADDRFIEQGSEKKLDACGRKRCGRNTKRNKVNPEHR